MRLIMAPIEMIAKFTVKGQPRPVKFRIEQEQERQEVTIDRIVSQEEEKLGGNRMLVYSCQSMIKGTERRYELKYEVATCRWFLSKI